MNARSGSRGAEAMSGRKQPRRLVWIGEDWESLPWERFVRNRYQRVKHQTFLVKSEDVPVAVNREERDGWCGNCAAQINGGCWACPPHAPLFVNLSQRFRMLSLLVWATDAYTMANYCERVRRRYSSNPWSLVYANSRLYEFPVGTIIRSLNDDLLDRFGDRAGHFPMGAGICKSCSPCAKRRGKPCNSPDRRISALEATGINVVSLLANLGLEVEWASWTETEAIIPRTIFYVGGILGNQDFQPDLIRGSRDRLSKLGYRAFNEISSSLPNTITL